MKICFPVWIGRRHQGLGNELIPWAKAFIASQELKIKFLPPALGLNDRHYYKYFGTSRWDWIYYAILKKVLPCYVFTEEEYLATGEKDFARAIRVYADKKGLDKKRSYALLTEGLWGNFYSIREAHHFVLSQLYRTQHLTDNLYQLDKQIADKRLIVGIHIRMGDFLPVTNSTEYKGVWNTRVSLAWYLNICRQLKSALGDAVTFMLLTDGTEEELRDFIDEFHPITNFGQPYAVVSDLLALASADVLVCSISSYSMWGAVLSRAPYFWYLPNLQRLNGHLTLWQEHVAGFGDNTNAEKILPRGIPMAEDSRIPDNVIEYLRMKIKLNSLSHDLIKSGGIPVNYETVRTVALHKG
jgi:Glycosyl transferase family 11